MKILLTGGAGYIGSPVLLCCLEAGFDFQVLDDSSNSTPEALARVEVKPLPWRVAPRGRCVAVLGKCIARCGRVRMARVWGLCWLTIGASKRTTPTDTTKEYLGHLQLSFLNSAQSKQSFG